MRKVRNVHERLINAPAERVGALLDRLASDDDPVWPAPAWPAMRFDRPLGVGAEGGHGPIRYTVEEYEPGVRIRFRFPPPGGGFHELAVEPLGPDRCRVRHDMVIGTTGPELLTWPLAVRWMHDAVVEEVLDNLQRAAGDTVGRPVRWTSWVRLLNRVLWERPRAVPAPPPEAGLARRALHRVDFADAWQVRLHPAMPGDPDTWAAAFARPPVAVRALLLLRQALVGLIGIRPGPARGGFPETGRTEHELLLGLDAGHLDFRLSVLTTGRAVTFTTVTAIHNRRGRLYWAVVRRLHPAVVRAMARRAHRDIALRSTPAARAGTAASGRPHAARFRLPRISSRPR
ncbi:DUF2867 domain-containing protein [Streptomyces aidingensis]|uniref:DUF2867 domain-containing protein n=1 Tax=Streptomyces aidingensis TaxID=910347 RepID=A0A1I1N3U9_9ACTN|nr:DUF2867 domain-containing protein [Streptomyces aidingensis]SFC90158.1 Protein of unknown function [Streptomyces aidingensis]